MPEGNIGWLRACFQGRAAASVGLHEVLLCWCSIRNFNARHPSVSGEVLAQYGLAMGIRLTAWEGNGC